MKYILKKKPERDKEFLSLHNITILSDENFHNWMLLVETEEMNILFNDWNVFPEKQYEVPNDQKLIKKDKLL